jgi:selenocysteine-specific elongation factor
VAPVIIGTAGHIDHGKTTLVRALTGVDTDRLKEEKLRGISIELGFAYVDTPDGQTLGFIDMPGHERFVSTMVAGACGIDLALLVVAVDDGVMPQTREHLAVLEFLGISRAVVALTKIDRADATRLNEVRAQVVALLSSSPLRDAPILAVHAANDRDPGLAALRAHLHDCARGHERRGSGQLFRLSIDRVFTLPGHGTIVTGTIASGVVHEQDTVTVMPSGQSARVRSVHAQNRPTRSARAGERCAMNLVGIDRESVERGDWLAAPELLRPSRRLDVRLRLLPNPRTPLAPGGAIHVHLGTTRRVARVVPLDSTTLSSESFGRAQLVFDDPVCALPGDRLIVRNAQATATLGGGIVLDPDAPARRRRSPQRLQTLNALEQLIMTGDLAPLLQAAPRGLETAELVRLTGMPAESLNLPGEALQLGRASHRYLILPEHWRGLQERVRAALAEFHRCHADEPGAEGGRLRRMTLPELPLSTWDALLASLEAEGILVRSGPWLHLPEHTAQVSTADLALLVQLAPLIASGRFDPPWVRDLAARVKESEARVREVLRKQVLRGELYQVVHDLFYDGGSMAELAAIARQLTEENGALNAARYRDAIGLGRKRTIQILEFFDRVGFTRRVRDSHVLRRDSGWDGVWKAHAPGGAAGLQTQKGAPVASW